MDDILQAAMRYLATPAGSFWKWVDDGKVVAWTHGATVAFREEVAAVLSRLAPRGLPPLDSVLLLLAATRIYWADDSKGLRTRLLEGTIRDQISALDRLHGLPSDLIHPVEAKSALADIVFELVPPAVTGEVARMVCDILAHGLVREHHVIPNLPRLRGGRVQTSMSLTRELSSLARGLAGISEHSLRLRLQTGLDEPPLPADVVIPADPIAIRGLLQQLALDDELYGLTRIVRQLSAVLQLPRALTDSDELPLGGVSDISNRGTLDRLLLSELAHDDVMLATRIALNEALYLRRETPPGPPPQRRHVLLDSGLRMWGVPRVFAAGTMLSLATTGTAGTSLLAYRASGSDAVPIDTSTREGLVSHLAALEPDAHPGRALIEFFERVTADEQPGDAIVITGDAALADPDFQCALFDAPPCYLATVNREGELHLWSRGVRGTKLLTSLKLDLDELLKPPGRPHARLVDPDVDPNLPAIFRVSPLPLRLPHQQSHQQEKEAAWSVRLPVDHKQLLTQPADDRQPVRVAGDSLPPSKPAYGVMSITRDRRLIFFDAPQRGAVQIADGIPSGKVLWSGSSADHHLCYALIHRPQGPTLQLLVVNVVLHRLVASRTLTSDFLAHKVQPVGAACQSGVLYVIFATKVEAFDLAEGQRLDQMGLNSEDLKWSGGRFFTDTPAPPNWKWGALTCDGSGLRIERIRLRGTSRAVLRPFDRPGHDGPFFVLARGSIGNLSDQTEWEWTSNPRANPVVIDVGDDGDRVLVEQDVEEKNRNIFGSIAARRIRRVIFTDDRTCVDVPLNIPSLAAWDLSRMKLGGTLMHRFTSIHVGADGRLVLTSKTQTSRELVIQNTRLSWKQVPLGQHRHAVATFEQTRHPNPGCTMAVATWKDGSRAFIDSRGLLHLQSSDRSVPEATLVLNDRDVAVWSSDGRVCGSPYFVDTGAGTSMPPAEFVNQILNPFIERLL